MESEPDPRQEAFGVLLRFLSEETLIRAPLPPKKEEAEVLMMCGLPGCGKTFWVEKEVKANPNKHYCIMSINAILSKMSVSFLQWKFLNFKYFIQFPLPYHNIIH